MINLVFEGNTEEPEEQEVGGCAQDEEECADAVVRVVLECKYGVCHENANSINEHTCYPEANILAVGLVGSLLGEHPEAAVEDEGGVDQGVGEPLHEQPGREAGSVDAHSVEHWVPHEVALQFSLRQSHLHVDVLLVLEVEHAVEENWQRSHRDVVHLIDQLLVEGLSRHCCIESEVELWYHIQKVLIEVV